MPDEQFPWADKWSDITDTRVRAAFESVQRAWFIDASLRDWAEHDMPLPIGEGQTISQPYIVALMLQAASLSDGDRVLEIGAGSGFQTALLCELTRENGQGDEEHVVSIERHKKLADTAVTRLADAGYHPLIEVADGAYGWAEKAPYDAIIVSAAAQCVPLPLWRQLATDGRLIIPVGRFSDDQILWLLRKDDSGGMQRSSLGGVRFVPLVSPLFEDKNNCLDIY